LTEFEFYGIRFKSERKCPIWGWAINIMKNIATFSIVARDEKTKELGIAVQSKFLAVGSAVSWAKASAGAIATQAMANLDIGEIGLQLLQKGYSAQQTRDALVALDTDIEHRQFGIVDIAGGAISFTGSKCFDYAGGHAENNLACQGNILVSKATVDAMVSTFKLTEGSLARRLVVALDAAQQAGGDQRGRQSASLLVVKEKGSYGGYNDRYIDLRVDDDPDPIVKLSHLLDLHEMYFQKTSKQDMLVVDAKLAFKIQHALKKLGFYEGSITEVFDELTKLAFENYCGWENFEERINPGNIVDKLVIDYLLDQADLAD
jgi:uncharacterized Ntn-hydrolase superfamily protein